MTTRMAAMTQRTVALMGRLSPGPGPAKHVQVTGVANGGTERAMHRASLHRAAAGAIAALLLFGGAACSDEDGDGNTADEESEQLEDRARDAGDEVEQQVDEGAEDSNDSGG